MNVISDNPSGDIITENRKGHSGARLVLMSTNTDFEVRNCVPTSTLSKLTTITSLYELFEQFYLLYLKIYYCNFYSLKYKDYFKSL